MNSTVGTSSLHHQTPVKVLGRAVYDIPELTDQRSLSEFFAGEPQQVDSELYGIWCRYLRATNQLNGSFYREVDGISPERDARRVAFKQASPRRKPAHPKSFWRRTRQLSKASRTRRTARR